LAQHVRNDGIHGVEKQVVVGETVRASTLQCLVAGVAA
jgi:hypothetical protein